MISLRTVLMCGFVVALSSAADMQCNGGVSCISLDQCVGLYEQIQKGITPELRILLRSLHCGFKGPRPKICCPPQFTSQTTKLLEDSKKCGIMSGQDKIVGGSQTAIDEHPWMALLGYQKLITTGRVSVDVYDPRPQYSNNGSGFYCGGVLISSKYVMTAAHCVKGKDLPVDWSLTHVRLGDWDVSSEIDCIDEDCNAPPQDIRIEEIIPHEQYDPDNNNQAHDIALLRLKSEAAFTDFVKPICLPDSNQLRQNLFEDQEMEVAGWGKTENDGDSKIKLKVRVPIVSTAECQRVYKRVNRAITTNQVCAGGVSGRDSCRGDSGGPLMGKFPSGDNWYALGVVSYGPTPCGTPNWPGVYTRVGAYVDWIFSKLRP